MTADWVLWGLVVWQGVDLGLTKLALRRLGDQINGPAPRLPLKRRLWLVWMRLRGHKVVVQQGPPNDPALMAALAAWKPGEMVTDTVMSPEVAAAAARHNDEIAAEALFHEGQKRRSALCRDSDLAGRYHAGEPEAVASKPATSAERIEAAKQAERDLDRALTERRRAGSPAHSPPTCLAAAAAAASPTTDTPRETPQTAPEKSDA